MTATETRALAARPAIDLGYLDAEDVELLVAGVQARLRGLRTFRAITVTSDITNDELAAREKRAVQLLSLMEHRLALASHPESEPA